MQADERRMCEEMLEEFRSLGGTAENVCIDEGPLGRGLFPVERAKPIRVHVPESLLLDVKHARIERNCFRVAEDAPFGTRERAFLENYQRDFSWGPGHGAAASLLKAISEAPDELRAFLEMPLQADAWLAGPTPEAVADRFFSSRVYGNYNGNPVIMPVMELINHGPGANYEDADGIAVHGQFSGEILVRYWVADPLEIFTTWGFGSPEVFALSLSLSIDTPEGRLIVKREPLPRHPGEKPFYPAVSVEDGAMTLSYMLLGHREAPVLSRTVFNDVMKQAGRRDVAEVFETIQHVNRMQFYKLAALAESAPPQLGRILSDVARYQLESMSYCIGAASG